LPILISEDFFIGTFPGSRMLKLAGNHRPVRAELNFFETSNMRRLAGAGYVTQAPFSPGILI
jgi:hypothetical protein